MIINIFNKIILFFALDKSDYNFIKESGYYVPTKVLNNKTNKRISCPDNMPSEYYQEIDFEEHIKLLLKDNNKGLPKNSIFSQKIKNLAISKKG